MSLAMQYLMKYLQVKVKSKFHVTNPTFVLKFTVCVAQNLRCFLSK